MLSLKKSRLSRVEFELAKLCLSYMLSVSLKAYELESLVSELELQKKFIGVPSLTSILTGNFLTNQGGIFVPKQAKK